MAQIKCAQLTSMDVWQHLKHRFTSEHTQLHDASSSRAMWQNLSASSWIKQTQLNDDDS